MLVALALAACDDDGATPQAWEMHPGDGDVPASEFCDDVVEWDDAWRQLELDVLALVNDARAHAADCGLAGSFGPTDALAMDPALRCAARKHSLDMATKNYFAHDSPSGETPADRLAAAGYEYSSSGENIAGGSADAAGTMMQWMDSDAHCSNIMNPGFSAIGIGYHPGGEYGTLWTQNFAAPL